MGYLTSYIAGMFGAVVGMNTAYRHEACNEHTAEVSALERKNHELTLENTKLKEKLQDMTNRAVFENVDYVDWYGDNK
jgi:regulator of replication initiation timing